MDFKLRIRRYVEFSDDLQEKIQLKQKQNLVVFTGIKWVGRSGFYFIYLFNSNAHSLLLQHRFCIHNGNFLENLISFGSVKTTKSTTTQYQNRRFECSNFAMHR